MTDSADTPPGDVPRTDPNALRGVDDHLNPLWIDRLRAHLAAGEDAEIVELMAPLHASDSGDVLVALEADERAGLVKMLGDRFDYSALTEVDDAIRTEIIEGLSNEQIARGVSVLDSDDAVQILEDIDAPAREEILARMPAFERLSLTRSLDFPEDSAGRRMQTEFIAIPPFWTVGQTIDYLREEKDLPDEFFQIYVVDPGYSLLGTLPLDKFLRARRQVRIEDIMNKNVFEVAAGED